jgi:hypothetical protein
MTTRDGGALPASNGQGTDSTVQDPNDEFLVAWTAGYLAGYERGHETRGREVNAEYPPPKVYAFGRWYDQALEREKADAETRRLLDEHRAAQRRAATRALDRHITRAYGTGRVA